MHANYDKLREEIIRRRGEETDHLDIYWEQYSDRTHFIYELLQNAEDTEATKVCFILNNFELKILHNGRVFVESSEKKDVTGICDIRKSVKESDLTRIGKLGMGFKSVYAYTDIPRIFSGEEHFRIEKLIRPFCEDPQPIPSGFSTLFILSFKNELREEAYNQISERLSDIGIRTLLFLRHIKEIGFEIYNRGVKELSGCYLRENDLLNNCQKIKLIGEITSCNETTGSTPEEDWLVFSRNIPLEIDLGNEHPKVSVAFLINTQNGESYIKRASNTYLNVFFPTHETTGLGFIIQGPYKTTPNRSEIPPKDDWNKTLIGITTGLLHDSLTEISEKGIVKPSISFIEALQINTEAIRDEMMPLFKLIIEVLSMDLKTLPLLPADDVSFVSAKNVRLPETNDVRKLLQNYLSEYIGVDYAIKWISKTLTPESEKTKEMFYFFKTSLNIDEISFESMCRQITNDDSSFLKNRIGEIDWFIDFYKSLYEKAPLKKQRYKGDYNNGWMRTRKIIITNNNELVQPFRLDDSNNVFLPTDVLTNELTINKKLLASQDMIDFFEWLKIAPPDVLDIIEKTIFGKYESGREIAIEENVSDISRIVTGINLTEDDKRKDRFMSNLLQVPFLIGFDKNTREKYYKKTSQLCVDSLLDSPSGLSDFFEIHQKYEVWPGYKNEKYFSNDSLKGFFSLIRNKKLGIMDSLSVVKVSTDNNQEIKKKYRDKITEYKIDNDYSIENIEKYLELKKPEASLMIWNVIIHSEDPVAWAKYSPNGSAQVQTEKSQLVQHLEKNNWIPVKSGEFKRPEDVTKEDLLPEFYFNENSELLKAIGFGRKVEQSFETLRQKQEFAAEFGASIEEIDELKDILKVKGLTISDLITKAKSSPSFPQKNARDPDRRKDIMAEKFANAEDKAYEIRTRRVRVDSVSSGEKKTYLENYYTNDDGIMVCQICEKEMPFQKRDGTYYYEAVEIFPNKRLSKHLSKNLPEQYIALCPECSARYNEYVVHNGSVMNELEYHIINGIDLWLHLGDISENNHEPFMKNIRFVETHLIDLQTILRKENNG
jgi:hypothetical protein